MAYIHAAYDAQTPAVVCSSTLRRHITNNPTIYSHK